MERILESLRTLKDNSARQYAITNRTTASKYSNKQKKMITMKYILTYGENHERYDLFRDLKSREDVQMQVRKEKKVNNKLINLIKKIHLSSTISRKINLPFKNIWFKKDAISFEENQEYCLIIVDMALITFSQKELNSFVNQPKVRTVLVLINSYDSETMKELGIKSKIRKTKWNDIYSFDMDDVRKHNFKPLSYCYYSLHDISNDRKVVDNDAYYIGALKESRKKIVFSVLDRLQRNNVNFDFHLMKLWKDRDKSYPYESSVDYYTATEKKISYEEVLKGSSRSNVIIEIVQEDQGGPTLRYYEAVTLNRKLLTNNANIKQYPFYNSNYMRVFKDADDIDIGWLMDREEVNYCYNGEFSPNNMLKTVLE